MSKIITQSSTLTDLWKSSLNKTQNKENTVITLFTCFIYYIPIRSRTSSASVIILDRPKSINLMCCRFLLSSKTFSGCRYLYNLSVFLSFNYHRSLFFIYYTQGLSLCILLHLAFYNIYLTILPFSFFF